MHDVVCAWDAVVCGVGGWLRVSVAGETGSGSSVGDGSGRGSLFLTTRWSVVLAAGRGESGDAREAMETLCRTYWRPLYGYVRRRGYSRHDAEDLTQGFFARLLERDDVAGVCPERGKFRSYLLGAMKHYLADEWDKARASKRGGGRVLVLDFASAETAYLCGAAAGEGPDEAYDRQWAVAVLEEVQRRLRRQYEEEGKGGWFEALRFTLAGDRGEQRYAGLARELQSTEGAVKTAVHRLRRRYRRLLQELVAETVATPGEVEEELRHLLRALADPSGR